MDQSFDAQVVNGQLVPADHLREFEGLLVHVTLSRPEPTAALAAAPVDDEAPADLDVEKDVYVAMPLSQTQVSSQIAIAGGALRPCLILPEDLGDE